MANSPFGNLAVKPTMHSPDSDVAASSAHAGESDFTNLYQRYEQFALFDAEKANFVNVRRRYTLSVPTNRN